MMKFSTLLIFLFVSILFNCTNLQECPTIQLGNQTFDEESLEYQVYNNRNNIVFIDSTGKDHVYTAELVLNQNSNYFSTTTCNGLEQTVVYEGSRVFMTFEGPDSTRIVFRHTIEFVEDEVFFLESRMVDVVNISIIDGRTAPERILKNLKIITSDKDGEIDIRPINDDNYEIEPIEDVYGKTFRNIFRTKTENPIGFTLELGVVSFHNWKNQLMVFDRFEQ